MSVSNMLASSLATRLLALVLATTTVVFVGVVSFVLWRMDRNAIEQAREFSAHSQASLSQRLESEANLAAHLTKNRLKEIEESVGRFAKRSDFTKVVLTSNIIEIKRMLPLAVAEAEISALLVLDERMRLVEGLVENDDAVRSANALTRQNIIKDIQALVKNNKRENPTAFGQIIEADAGLVGALGVKGGAGLVQVMAHPIFDDFGDVFGVIVASRKLRPDEPVLQGLHSITRVGLAISHGTKIVSSAGLSDPALVIALPGLDASQLSFQNGLFYRCAPLLGPTRLCAFSSEEELKQQSDALIKISEAQAQALTVSLAIIATLAMLALGLTLFVTLRSATSPLRQIAKLISLAAKGEALTGIIGLTRRDEVGQIARALEVFQSGLAEREQLRAQQREQERIAAVRKSEEMEALARSFEGSVLSIVEQLSDASSRMQSSAATLANSSNAISGQTISAASAVNETSVNVRTMAVSTEEIAASIKRISAQTDQAWSVSEEATKKAKAGVEFMTGLDTAVSQINDVVKIISTIANQTNLLALNATIEAARAGDAGKGFAVVAGEVKALASQTAAATHEITRQINAVQDVAGCALNAIREVNTAIPRIGELSTAIARAMREQDTATGDIAKNIEQAALGVEEVNGVITEVSQAAQMNGDASGAMLATASGLQAQARTLRLEVEGFLRKIRAA